MHITTSSHILSLADDHIYNLRKLGTANDDSWLDSRRGEAFDRNLQVRLENGLLCLSFEGKSIGHVGLNSAQQVRKVLDLVTYWNARIGPTDLTTIKTMELVRDWNQLLMRRDLQVKTVTYNCAGLLGDLAVRRELWMRLFGDENEVAADDVIVLGFQETDNLNRSVKANVVTLQRVADHSKNYLYRTHTLVSTIQLLGIMTLLFVKNELIPHVSKLSTDTSSTGFLRVWGNKGAVLTRFNLFRDDIVGGGLEISVVNCHLSAGEGVTQIGRRRWELREIGNKFGIAKLSTRDEDGEIINPNEFSDDVEGEGYDSDSISSISDEELESEGIEVPLEPKETHRSVESASRSKNSVVYSDDGRDDSSAGLGEKATSSVGVVGSESTQADGDDEALRLKADKYIILLGDMNYRILLSEKEVQKKVKKQEWDGLLAHDSLSLERHQYSVLAGFEEPAVRFAPTYKYEIGSSTLRGRVPSYTDRILYRTSCATRVVTYKSVPELKLSDHRPVSLRNVVHTTSCIDPDKHAAIMQRSLKILDAAENNARPKLAVDQQQLNIEGPPFSVQQVVLTLKNEGVRPIHWTVENAETAAEQDALNYAQSQPVQSINSSQTTTTTTTTAAAAAAAAAPPRAEGAKQSTTSKTSKKEPTSTSSSSSALSTSPAPAQTSAVAAFAVPKLIGQGLEIGNTIRTRRSLESKTLSAEEEICVAPGKGKLTSSYPLSEVRISARIGVKASTFIVLVRTESIRSKAPENLDAAVQKYVFIRIEPAKSYLGSALSALPKVDDIPVPIRQCVEYLWDRRLDDMFLAAAEPNIFQQVVGWLDRDSLLDLQVLDALDPASDRPVGVYAVSQYLLAFFRYLPDILMTPNMKRKVDAADQNMAVLRYICRFLNHLQVEDDALDLWATILYDHYDEKAGKMEKRAYLRSMLICNLPDTSKAGA